MSDLRIVMTGEPRGKGRHRTSLIQTKAGKTIQHHYPDPKTARFEERLAWTAQAEMRGRSLYEGALTVTLTVFASIPQSKPKKWKDAAAFGLIRPTGKPDLDNTIKTVLDALNKVVWIDDCQVVRLVCEKYYSDSPRVEITVNNL